MIRADRERTYQDCSVGGATPIGLLVALFDRLANDLRRAANAIRVGDIETRCSEINHALIIVGQLESWVDVQNGGFPALQISKFYAQLRSAMVQASIMQSAEILDMSIESILRIRSSWHELDTNAGDLAIGSDAFLVSSGVSNPEGVSFSFSA